jgi:hypothetical protein
MLESVFFFTTLRCFCIVSRSVVLVLALSQGSRGELAKSTFRCKNLQEEDLRFA